ncbi:MAG: thioredoxin family protein [Deltaproteobacteria bacterium]|nr:thioredoxin family protein [Deltaproteobacteria bacterium]
MKNYKGSKRTVAMLEQLAAKMRDHVSIIIAYEENWSRVRSEMKIDGTPTFIFFVSGQERGRILGKATSRYLQTAARQWFRDGSQSKERK